jgi:hypothetical protein
MNLTNLKKLIRNKQNLTFFILSILMFVLVVLYAYYSISYLAKKTVEGLDGGEYSSGVSAKFNLEKMEELKAKRLQN